MEDDQGVLWYKGRICLPNVMELKDKILQEAHESTYSIHLGGNKMYYDLKESCWWYRIKRDVALATPVRESRSSIKELLGCCNLCKYVSGSGKRLLWIFSWDCLGLSLGLIPLG
jgi:hypothetical protein